jgi:signal transduction histidine kinase
LADAESSPHKSSLYSVETTDLETAILGAKLECRDALQRSGGEFVIGPLPPCAVPQKTQTILKELFDNSIRYAAPDRPPRVEISASLNARKIQVRVADNGTGLPAAYTGKLFQPMQRLDAARSGFGLGLAIAKAVVEAAGGAISFEISDPGATFVFELPCRDG